MNRYTVWIVAAAASLLLISHSAQAKGPLKVFILAGQSNMQGHAGVRTVSYIAKDPKTEPMYHDIMGADGKPRVCKNVWITYFSGDRGKTYYKQGKLTTGFGANPGSIGPELTFGIYMEKQLGEPILIIKTAWGGKSLHTDFRPPSAGPYQFNAQQLAKFKKQGKDLAKEQAEKAKHTGHYYKLMIQDVKKVLADPGKYCPAYDPKQGYQLAGFVWFQGWNDMVDRNVYPNRSKPGGYDLYTKLLGDFIRDVRSDLKAPKLPFVIGVMGVGGEKHVNQTNQNFRDAMAATAMEPQFKDTVVNVQTAKCWDPFQSQTEDVVAKLKQQVKAEVKKMQKAGTKTPWKVRQKMLTDLLAKKLTPAEMTAHRGTSNFAFHYMGSAKILGCIGKHFADAMYPLVQKEDQAGK